MICYVYRRRRRINGKSVPERVFRGRIRLEPTGPISDFSLGVCDKQVAEKKLAEKRREVEQEAAGIALPKVLVESAKKKLVVHLGEFLGDLRAKGRDEEYVYTIEKRLTLLFSECGWEALKDPNPDGFVRWRQLNCSKSPATLNQYLTAFHGFFGWLKNQNRVLIDPFQSIGRADTRGKEVRKRRALKVEELTRLLEVSGHRKIVYLAAASTGLRRNEMAQLRKNDVHLGDTSPFILVRSSTAKNKKKAKIPLTKELVEELRPLLAQISNPNDLVFPKLPTVYRLKKDLEAAGIPFLDDQGMRVDFHSLRHTLNTMLFAAGVSERVIMEIMRHSEIRLTVSTYTDARHLPVSDAVEKLPRFSLNKPAQIDTHPTDASFPTETQPVIEAFSDLKKITTESDEKPVTDNLLRRERSGQVSSGQIETIEEEKEQQREVLLPESSASANSAICAAGGRTRTFDRLVK